MDFFTVDTIFNKRFYVYFIIHHKTREIIQFAITKNPIKEFVRQQLIIFKEELENSVYMIHDNGSQMFLNYTSLGIKAVRTSVKAPNMNAICERVIRSIRQEALDNFIIVNQKQLHRIILEYIEFYNERRLHQSLEQDSPRGLQVQNSGAIHSRPMLGGLFYDCFCGAEVPV
jgi:transposase InsO family protein